MLVVMIQLLFTLLVILAAAELFTNALEHLGERLGLSEGVTGSIFAAVGTALPETLVPLIAVFDGGARAQVNQEIAVGAILGAPLMLSTLTFCLVGLAAMRRRGARGELRPEPTGMRRDLAFFLVAALVATAAMFAPAGHGAVRLCISAALVGLYVLYLRATLKASAGLVADGHATEAEAPMLLSRIGLPCRLPVILLQLGLALALLVAGAKGFIASVETVARLWGISALLLSLVVVPVATELPEKINSVLWIRRGKDTLAFGNVTGAMVFQMTLLPAIGIVLTPWTAQRDVVAGLGVILAAVLWLRAAARGGLRPWHLIGNGLLYLSYLLFVVKG